MEGTFNIWSIALLISVAQAIVLVGMLLLRHTQNVAATRILIAMITGILLVNFDYFLISSTLYRSVPSLVGLSFGLMYLFGPLFYLYMRSITDSTFRWKNIYWLHFLPLALRLILNIPLYLLDKHVKRLMVSSFLEGKSHTNGFFFYSIALPQVTHLCIYLTVAYRLMKKTVIENSPLVPLSQRVGWLKLLFYSNLVFVISFVGWCTIAAVRAVFIPSMDYVSTLICSAMVFLIAFKLVLGPEVVTPGFDKKYKSSPLNTRDTAGLVQRLVTLMEDEKMYTEPGLKLEEVADQLDVTTHVMSQIINEQFDRSFIDFINEYRVREFKKRLAGINGEKINILSLALEVGFNSKSAFNAAFKKITNQTPSEFKKSLPS